MSRLTDLGHRSYADYLKSRHWRRLRQRYRRSSLPQGCQAMVGDARCGVESVELHHWTYRRLGNERLTDLVPLCADHHEAVHNQVTGRASDKAIKKATATICGDGPWGSDKRNRPNQHRRRRRARKQHRQRLTSVARDHAPLEGAARSRPQPTWAKRQQALELEARKQHLKDRLQWYIANHEGLHPKVARKHRGAIRQKATNLGQRAQVDLVLAALAEGRVRWSQPPATGRPDTTGLLRR